jgi:hypothetical protein
LGGSAIGKIMFEADQGGSGMPLNYSQLPNNQFKIIIGVIAGMVAAFIVAMVIVAVAR